MDHASVWIMSWHCNSERIDWLGDNEDEDDEKFNSVSGTQWIEQYWQSLPVTNKEYKENLIDVIDDLTRHFYITKLKITSFWCSTKSKATTGVKNTAS